MARSSYYSSLPEPCCPRPHHPQHCKFQMAALDLLCLFKIGLLVFFCRSAKEIISACCLLYFWPFSSIGCRLAVWINISSSPHKPTHRGFLNPRPCDTADLSNLIHNTCPAVLRGKEGSDALAPYHPHVQRDHLMTVY